MNLGTVTVQLSDELKLAIKDMEIRSMKKEINLVNCYLEECKENKQLKFKNKSLNSDMDFFIKEANWSRTEDGYRKHFVDDEELEKSADLFDEYTKDHKDEETAGKIYTIIDNVVIETLEKEGRY